MGNTQNIIELNGKKYDVATGKLLGATKPIEQRHTQATQNNSKGVILDGFMRKAPSKKPLSRHGQVNAHAVHRQNERSKTLMRKHVAKPKVESKTNTTPSSKELSVHKTTTTVPHSREVRATVIPKSKLISKFGFQRSSNPIIGAFVPVKEEPSTMRQQPANNIQQEFRQQDTHANSTAAIFQAAMNQSSSHDETFRPERKKIKLTRRISISQRLVSTGSLTLAALILGLFIMYQNVPNLNMRLAAARSGVDGSLPAYKPAGFGMAGPIKYNPGKIVIGFKSVSDTKRSFEITQTNSKWTSESLLENFINNERGTYQTYQDKGKTIYLYDGNNATWVDGGIWYKVEGNANLSSTQLINLATSFK